MINLAIKVIAFTGVMVTIIIIINNSALNMGAMRFFVELGEPLGRPPGLHLTVPYPLPLAS